MDYVAKAPVMNLERTVAVDVALLEEVAVVEMLAYPSDVVGTS